MRSNQFAVSIDITAIYVRKRILLNFNNLERIQLTALLRYMTIFYARQILVFPFQNQKYECIFELSG